MMKPRFLCLAAAVMLTACSSPKNTYYTLNAQDLPPSTTLTHKTRVLVGPVSVPAVIDTPQLVLRNDSNQVSVYEYHRWAGSLKSDIERVMATDLSRDLLTPNVWSYSQSPFAPYDYQVFIDVQNMDSQLGESVTLDVLWTIKPSPTQTSAPENVTSKKLSQHAAVGHPKTLTGRSQVREAVSGKGFDALVAAQSRAFDQVSRDIANALKDR